MGRKPKNWTAVDRDDENLRVGMQTLFQHVGIDTLPAAAWTTFCRSDECKRLGDGTTNPQYGSELSQCVHRAPVIFWRSA
jgi:hypothetical protein